MRRFFTTSLLIGLCVLAADQLVKWLVVSNLVEGGGFTVLEGLFDIRYVRNPGASFGILAGKRWLLVGYAGFALLIFYYFAKRLFAHLPAGAWVLGLLTGGTIGNLLDRVFRGYVVDYLDFYWGNSHFPAFNVADSAICISVALLLLAQWIDEYRRRRQTKFSHADHAEAE